MSRHQHMADGVGAKGGAFRKGNMWVIVAALLLTQGALVAYLLQRSKAGEKSPDKTPVAAVQPAADTLAAAPVQQPDAAPPKPDVAAPTPDQAVPTPDVGSPDKSPSATPAVAVVARPHKPSVGRRPGRRPGRGRRPKGPKAQPETVKPATVSVRCTPRARISVDGQAMGSTPLALSLEPGAHRVELQADGFKPYKRSIKVAAGENRSMDVALRAIPKPAPKPVVAQKPPAPKPAPTPAPTPAAPKKIPTLKLPRSVRVTLYTEEGQRSRFASMVLFAVERAVTQGIGISARGTTGPLLRHLYRQYKDEDDKVKLYPRTMGYFIAQALVQGKKGVGGSLVSAFRSGRIEKLADSNWKPK